VFTRHRQCRSAPSAFGVRPSRQLSPRRPRPATVRRRVSQLRDCGVAWLPSCDAWPPPSLPLRDSLMLMLPPMARLRAMWCQQPPPSDRLGYCCLRLAWPSEAVQSRWERMASSGLLMELAQGAAAAGTLLRIRAGAIRSDSAEQQSFPLGHHGKRPGARGRVGWSMQTASAAHRTFVAPAAKLGATQDTTMVVAVAVAAAGCW
jgi:hypothetical protein